MGVERRTRESIRGRLHEAAGLAEAGDNVGVVRLLAPCFSGGRPNEKVGLALAAAYYEIGNLAMALAVVEALEARGGARYATAFLRGRIQEDRERYEQATGAYRKALEIAPREAEPRIRLAEMALRVADIASARRWTRLSDVPEGIDPRLTFLRGQALLKDGLYYEALREFRLAQDAGLKDERLERGLKEVQDVLAERRAHMEELSRFAEGGAENLPPGLAHADFAEDYVTCLMNLGRREEALRYVEKAVQQFPVDPGLHALRARVLLDTGRYEEGLLAGNRVSELEGDTDFLDWCGEQVEGLVGDEEERHRDYTSRAAHADAPTRAIVLANAAVLTVNGDRRAQARQLAREAVAACADSQAAQELAAHVAASLGDFADAVARYRACLERWPRAETWAALGSAYLSLGDASEGYRAFRRALELSPDYDLPHYNLAVLAAQRGDYERAARECRLALDANENCAPALQLLKECSLRLGRLDEVEDICHQLLDMPNADSADALRSLGNVWEARGDTDRAVDHYVKAMQDTPEDPRLMLDIGRLCARNEIYDDAERFLDRVLELEPDQPAALDTLGQMCVKMGRVAEGARLLGRAVKRAPNAFEPAYHLGRALIRRRRWRQAQRHLEAALKLRPYSSETLAALGQALRQQGRNAKAVQRFREGLKCDPENFELLRGLAEMHFMAPAGRWVGAREAHWCLRAALSRAPSRQEVLWVLERLKEVEAVLPREGGAWGGPEAAAASGAAEAGPLCALPAPAAWAAEYCSRKFDEDVAERWPGRPAEVQRHLTRAIQLGTHSVALFRHRAITRAMLGRWAEAVPDLSEVIRLEPKRGAAFLERGVIHDALGDTDSALADLGRAIELDPGCAAAYERRGAVLLRLGSARQAASDFTSALALQEDMTPALWGRARALLEMNQPGLAADDLTRALQLSPGSGGLLSDRGECFRRLGQSDAALADFAAATAADPELSVAVENRCLLLQALGRAEEAEAELERALRRRPGDERLAALRARPAGGAGG